jgi:hypothetical protein
MADVADHAQERAVPIPRERDHLVRQALALLRHEARWQVRVNVHVARGRRQLVHEQASDDASRCARLAGGQSCMRNGGSDDGHRSCRAQQARRDPDYRCGAGRSRPDEIRTTGVVPDPPGRCHVPDTVRRRADRIGTNSEDAEESGGPDSTPFKPLHAARQNDQAKIATGGAIVRRLPPRNTPRRRSAGRSVPRHSPAHRGHGQSPTRSIRR